jgi:type I restriction enzyme R subunit
MAGLDLQAANQAFSEFLTDESLNIYQMRFVKLIVEYVVKNGLIEDKRVMNEDPFKSVGSISFLFKHNKEKAMKIVKIIDDINRNGEEIDIA